MSGVDRNAPVVIDVEDKVTSIDEENTIENQFNMLLRTLHNTIGETSNYSTVYHNKMPQTEKQKKKYESYIDLLSIINGKAINENLSPYTVTYRQKVGEPRKLGCLSNV